MREHISIHYLIYFKTIPQFASLHATVYIYNTHLPSYVKHSGNAILIDSIIFTEIYILVKYSIYKSSASNTDTKISSTLLQVDARPVDTLT